MYSSFCWHSGCFTFWATVNYFCINSTVQLSVQFSAFNYFSYIFRSISTKSDDHSMFNFQRIVILFHILIENALRFQFLHILASIYYYYLLLNNISHNAWKAYFIVVFISISISMMINNVDCLLMCLSGICIHSLKKCIFRYFTHVLIYLFSFRNYLCVLDTCTLYSIFASITQAVFSLY